MKTWKSWPKILAVEERLELKLFKTVQLLKSRSTER